MAIHRYMSPAARFWPRVEKSAGCWLWTGLVDKDGYGRIRVNGRQTRTHRLSYEMHFETIPDGMAVCHRCDTPACVRPDHLFLGTAGDNNEDRRRKGRSASGDANASRLYPERRPRGDRHHWRTKPHTRLLGTRNGRAKLSPEDVRAIRTIAASGITKVELAERYGVSDVAIGNIIARKSWAHIE